VERFAGMFALALYEHASGRLVLARDRLGVKPLYLSASTERLRFASTLPALLAGGGVDTRLDPTALHHYLSWHAVVPAPHTILLGVQKLPPATVLTIEADGRQTEQRYWRASFSRQAQYADFSDRDWAQAVLEALRTAVQRRMVADVPVGVLLSGGLDSSLIVGLLAAAGQRGLATFSVGFDDVGTREGNEFRYSDLIASEFETDHHRIHVPTERMLPALDGPRCGGLLPALAGGVEVAQGGAVWPGGRRGVRRLLVVPASGRSGQRRRRHLPGGVLRSPQRRDGEHIDGAVPV
jgi:asparagine synthase (glutamine-hydrolysing)